MFSLDKVSESELKLVVKGSLYGAAALEFEKWLEVARESSYPTLILDLTMAIGITSAGIGKLLSLRKRLLDQNRTLKIRGCNETLYRTFTAIKLDKLIEITKDARDPAPADGKPLTSPPSGSSYSRRGSVGGE